MVEQDIKAQLITFIRDRILAGDPGRELDEATPLLEWGVLNSLSIALLLNFIRDDLRVVVPLEKVNAQNFRDVRCIAALVHASMPGDGGTALSSPRGRLAGIEGTVS